MSRMVRITLRLDAQLVADIDRQCRRLGCSRSAFIRDALHWHIASEQKKLLRKRRTRGKRSGHKIDDLVHRIPKGKKPGAVDWGRPVGREVQ